MKTFIPPRSRKKWVKFEIKGLVFGTDTVTDTEFGSHTTPITKFPPEILKNNKIEVNRGRREQLNSH